MGLRIGPFGNLQALHEAGLARPGTVAGFESGVGLEGLGQADDPRPGGIPGSHRAPIEDQPTVGQAPQIDARPAAELDPLPIGEGLGRSLGEEVAPIGGALRAGEGADFRVCAGGYGSERFAECIADC